jgi:hypothetical protein
MVAVDSQKQRIDKKNYQNGLKEPLLCRECDNQLGILDGYANKILFDIIPNREVKVFNGPGKTYLLNATEFDYNKLRKFFISLVWRASICKSESFSLGKYEEIALKILKNEIPADKELFLPLIFRKNTNTSADRITAFFKGTLFGKHMCHFRFPNYEIAIITNTKNSADDNAMNNFKRMFSRDQILVIETTEKTSFDDKLISNVIEIRKAKH